MTTRAARCERGALVTLGWIGFSVPQDGPVSQCGVAEAVATLPLEKGPKGFVRGGAW